MHRALWVAWALLLLAGGGLLVYFAGWIAATDIAPQVARGRWSLEGSNMILNRDWRGNQLYLLVALYLSAGLSLAAGGVLRLRGLRRD